MTALILPTLLVVTVFFGSYVALFTYAPSSVARKILFFRVGLAFRHAYDRIAYMRSGELRKFFGYQKCIRELQAAGSLRHGFEKHVATLGPEVERYAHQTTEYAMIERCYERKLRQAAMFLGHMSDEQLGHVAKFFRDAMLDEAVPVSVVADFLKGERQAIKKAPYMAVGHFARMLARMTEIKSDNAAASR